MAIPSELTVSISKAKTSETSTAHNDRKTRLKNATNTQKEAFYEHAGHKHIHKEYTDLNTDFIKDPRKLYDKLFEKAVFDYNTKQKRKDREIGKGLALTVKEKQGKVVLLSFVHEYKQIKSKKKREKFLEDLTKTQPKVAKSLKEVLPTFKQLSVCDTRKMLTQAKHARTFGEALYDKQKRSKQSSTHVEFVFQIGSAEDFNEIDSNGRIKKSYDRKDPNGIWQKSKRVLKKYEKQFEKQNPNLAVTNWSIHMDESTPHMHLEVVPFAETAKTLARGKKHKGLSVKVSFDGALECEGFKRDPHDSRKGFTAWQNREADTLAKIMHQELGVTRKKGITNRLKNVYEYKKVKEEVVKQRENANNYKKIANKNASLANQNYDIYEKNSKAVETKKAELDKLTKAIPEAQKKLSSVSKEKQRQLDALNQEIAQKRSEKLRELSKEIEEKRKNEEKKLKAREDAVKQRDDVVKQREDAVKQRDDVVKQRETDLTAIQFGGVDSKGIKHKSIEQRIRDGIKAGMTKVQNKLMQPLKAFTYAYRKSIVKYQHPTYTSSQVDTVADRQEKYLAKKAGGSRARILQELASDRFEKPSIKAIRAGTKALAKELPNYQAVDEAIKDSILLDQLEHEEKQHAKKQQKQTPTPTVSKDDSPDFSDDF